MSVHQGPSGKNARPIGWSQIWKIAGKGKKIEEREKGRRGFRSRSPRRIAMKIFGRYYVYPRQLVLAASGLLFLGSTTYDVHRSIKNNAQPPSEEQMRHLHQVLSSSGRPPPSMPASSSDPR